MPLEATTVESRPSTPVCQVCGDSLRPPVHACPYCETPHHLDCWTYNEGCSTYGCRGALSTLQPFAAGDGGKSTKPESALARRLRQGGRLLLFVVLALVTFQVVYAVVSGLAVHRAVIAFFNGVFTAVFGERFFWIGYVLLLGALEASKPGGLGRGPARRPLEGWDEEALAEAARRDPADPAVLAERLVRALGTGDLDGGRRLLEEGLVHDPGNGTLHYYLGKVRAAMGDGKGARAHLEQAAALGNLSDRVAESTARALKRLPSG